MVAERADGNEKQCGQEGMDGNEWQCGQEGADGHGLQVQARCSKGIDYAHKENFEWISMIRLPEFVTKEEFLWAIGEATEKKQADFSKVEFFTYDEWLCVQCMHIGSYDDGSGIWRKTGWRPICQRAVSITKYI